jgi:hypothetical protein
VRGDPAIPRQIGPVVFGRLGRRVTVRCPAEYAPLMRKAGGTWEPGSHRWLIHVRRIGPVLRVLHRVTDPLFRRAGIDPDVPILARDGGRRYHRPAPRSDPSRR